MSTPADATHLPEYGSEEFKVLQRSLVEAADQGDLATLQQAGAATISKVHLYLIDRALKHGQVHVATWLVEESARTGVDIAMGWQSVHLASFQGHLDKLKATSEKELMQRTDYDEETVLHAAARGDQVEAIKYLVRERGMDVDSQDALGWTVLEKASKRGSVPAIEALVECGASLHGEQGQPLLALETAAEYSRVAAMEKLVELGADISIVGSTGGVMHAAAKRRHVGGAECAARLGADPRAVDRRGRTALHVAASRDNHSMAKPLVRLGVPVDAADHDGWTGLHLAHQFPQTCRALLDLGADRWIKDGHGRTVRDLAIVFPNSEEYCATVQLLDTYWPILPSMAQLLLGLRGPSESPLTRFAAHSAFEPQVLSLVNCLLVGKDDKAYEQLVEESTGDLRRRECKG